MSKKRLGRAFVKVNGKLYETEVGASLDIGGTERETREGSHTIYFTEKPAPSLLECEISLAPGTSLEEIRNITNATITFECDTGQTYLVPNAWITETLIITEGEGGKIPLKFAGAPAQEL